MITKEEVYKNLVHITKETGQGLSGIVKVMREHNSLYSKHLDDLVKEGLVKSCHTGGSLGHEESNIFYMPSNGYNVWEDEGVDGYYSHHKGRYLTFVRLYLGIVDKNPDSPIDPSLTSLLQNPEVMKEYSEWLDRNSEALKEMIGLSDSLPKSKKTKKSPTTNSLFSEEEISWIKKKSWYEENQPAGVCLKRSLEYIEEGTDKEIVKSIKQIMPLLKMNPEKYRDKIEEYEKDLLSVDIEMGYRLKFNDFISTQDKNKKIQSLIK